MELRAGDVVKRVLLTGMSGTGKSTVVAELAARGYKAVDADDPALSELVSVPVDEPTGLDPGQDWVWREDRIQELLSSDDADVLFLSSLPNQGMFYPQFDHIILLTAPVPVIVERLATRTTNATETSRGSLAGAEPSGNDRAVVEKSRRVRRRYVRPPRSGGRGDSQDMWGYAHRRGHQSPVTNNND